MKEWNRTTEEISLSKLPAACQAAIDAHLERFNLGKILEQPTMGIKVVSNKIKKRLFSGIPNQVESYVFLTHEWLVWTVSTGGDAPTVISAKLENITVEDYANGPNYALIQDNGAFITGKLTGMVGTEGQEQVSMFIGWGEEPDAENFKEALMKAIEKTRR